MDKFELPLCCLSLCKARARWYYPQSKEYLCESCQTSNYFNHEVVGLINPKAITQCINQVEYKVSEISGEMTHKPSLGEKWKEWSPTLQEFATAVKQIKEEFFQLARQKKWDKTQQIWNKIQVLRTEWKDSKILNLYLHYVSEEKERQRQKGMLAEPDLLERNHELETKLALAIKDIREKNRQFNTFRDETQVKIDELEEAKQAKQSLITQHEEDERSIHQLQDELQQIKLEKDQIQQNILEKDKIIKMKGKEIQLLKNKVKDMNKCYADMKKSNETLAQSIGLVQNSVDGLKENEIKSLTKKLLEKMKISDDTFKTLLQTYHKKTDQEFKKEINSLDANIRSFSDEKFKDMALESRAIIENLNKVENRVIDKVSDDFDAIKNLHKVDQKVSNEQMYCIISRLFPGMLEYDQFSKMDDTQLGGFISCWLNSKVVLDLSKESDLMVFQTLQNITLKNAKDITLKNINLVDKDEIFKFFESSIPQKIESLRFSPNPEERCISDYIEELCKLKPKIEKKLYVEECKLTDEEKEKLQTEFGYILETADKKLKTANKSIKDRFMSCFEEMKSIQMEVIERSRMHEEHSEMRKARKKIEMAYWMAEEMPKSIEMCEHRIQKCLSCFEELMSEGKE
ncbi:unnamed protein product [Moneuplotes crassus]|uniref:Uncharacterized protein n=1 Tax=Euplotes crassus TaxID=5936 RepID=A0AAD1U058_EUPCR|nr:unnamed protein product [Moneuplotes crassus]